MPIKFSSDKPIFLQVADIIKSDISCGKYKTTEKLPSVREFAIKYSVNPNTVQKSLQILEEEGLIATDRTNGKFVSESLEIIKLQKNKIINEEIKIFYEKLQNLGLSKTEIKNIINKFGG